VAAQFLASAELLRTYGELGDGALITALYHNVLQRAPDADGLTFWQAYLDGAGARADLLASFSESAENQQQTFAAIADGVAYLPLYSDSVQTGERRSTWRDRFQALSPFYVDEADCDAEQLPGGSDSAHVEHPAPAQIIRHRPSGYCDRVPPECRRFRRRNIDAGFS